MKFGFPKGTLKPSAKRGPQRTRTPRRTSVQNYATPEDRRPTPDDSNPTPEDSSTTPEDKDSAVLEDVLFHNFNDVRRFRLEIRTLSISRDSTMILNTY